MEGRAVRVVMRRQEAPQGGFVPLQAVEEGALARVHPVKSSPPSPVLPGPLFCPLSLLACSLSWPFGSLPSSSSSSSAWRGLQASMAEWQAGAERGGGQGHGTEGGGELARCLSSLSRCFGAPLLFLGCPRLRARRIWRPLIQCTTAQHKGKGRLTRGEESTKRRRRRRRRGEVSCPWHSLHSTGTPTEREEGTQLNAEEAVRDRNRVMTPQGEHT